jgi:hypothetical protein
MMEKNVFLWDSSGGWGVEVWTFEIWAEEFRPGDGLIRSDHECSCDWWNEGGKLSVVYVSRDGRSV